MGNSKSSFERVLYWTSHRNEQTSHITATPAGDWIEFKRGEELNNPSGKTFKMICGHFISSRAMKMHCNKELSKGKTSICCPVNGCDKIWPFSVVKNIVSLSSTVGELEELETKICENFIDKKEEIQKCSECESFVEKDANDISDCPGCLALHEIENIEVSSGRQSTLKEPVSLQTTSPWFKITTTEADVITGEYDPSEKTVKMFCGHVISSMSMKDHCNYELSKGRTSICCAVYECNQIWPFSVVKYIASFSSIEEELEEMETNICENFINRKIEIQKCPQCDTFVEKAANVTSNRVECLSCFALHGKQVSYCWLCLQHWKTTNSDHCGNKNCNGTESKLDTLRNCEEKIILGRSTPSIRACPKCGLLVEHIDRCIRVCCTGCKFYFCFYCLKWADDEYKIPCRPFDSECEIAPRQTILPETSVTP